MAFIPIGSNFFENTTLVLRPRVSFLCTPGGLVTTVTEEIFVDEDPPSEWIVTTTGLIEIPSEPESYVVTTYTTQREQGSVSGSLYVNPLRSRRILNLSKLSLNPSKTDYSSLSAFYDSLSDASSDSADSFSQFFLDFLSPLASQGLNQNEINAESLLLHNAFKFNSGHNPNGSIIDLKHLSELHIYRFDAPPLFNGDFSVKNNIRKVIQPKNKHVYPQSGFKYTNYNTLNFFTGSAVPSDSALVYPSVTGSYFPTNSANAFTLNFWINPRHDNQTAGADYHAGTIFHISSSIAVSLVSGSQLDTNEKVDSFKILLQLSHSADINPSSIDINSPNGSYPRDLIFTSSFELKKKHWHNVNIQWGGATHNNYSGSISVDENKTDFAIPSGSLFTSNYSSTGTDSDFIVLGNYFDSNPADALLVFNSTISSQQGLTQKTVSSTEISNQSSKFKNPLNAEIHDIKLFDKFLSLDELSYIKTKGVGDYKILNNLGISVGNAKDIPLIFYVPVYFYPVTRERDVFTSAFTSTSRTTDKPFNAELSFRTAGRIINLENFTRDFATGEYPRLLSLTGSLASSDTATVSRFNDVSNANYITTKEWVYTQRNLVKRNLTILPNDNGLVRPNFYIISKDLPSLRAQNLASRYYEGDPGQISLEDMASSSKIFAASQGAQQGDMFILNAGPTPESGYYPSQGGVGPNYAIPSRTGDLSSNEVTVLNVSNLFYGNRIFPSTFSMIDNNVTGSGNVFNLKLYDNGRGSLYRRDCKTFAAFWNNVGDIFYDEGIALIKSPHLPYFCKDYLKVDFRGEQNLHTMILNVPVQQGMVNSSSNETFKSIPPSLNRNDKDKSAIYITSLNIHDNNFNIIMKAHFAQPIIKADDDEFVVRLKQDF